MGSVPQLVWLFQNLLQEFLALCTMSSYTVFYITLTFKRKKVNEKSLMQTALNDTEKNVDNSPPMTWWHKKLNFLVLQSVVKFSKFGAVFCFSIRHKCWFCQTTLKRKIIIQNVLFSLNFSEFRSRNASVLCMQIVRPQNEQVNARTTAWAWWLNTDRWLLISAHKAFWSRLKAAKPLQVKTFRLTLKRR